MNHAKQPCQTEHPAISMPARVARALLGTVLLLAFLAPPASAAYYVHPPLFEFGPDGTEDAMFQKETHIAVDPASHDIYVADGFANRVYRFNSSGVTHNFSEGEAVGRNWLAPHPLSLIYVVPAINGIAVAPAGAAGGTAGDIYVSWHSYQTGKPSEPANLWGVEVYSPGGAHLGTIDGSGDPHHSPTESSGAFPCGVAVDAAGSVYVSNCAAGNEGEVDHIDKYVPAANPVTDANFDSEIETGFSGLDVVAGESALYVVVQTRYKVLKTFPYSVFPGGGGSADATGEGTQLSIPGPENSIFPGDSGAFAVDRSSGDLYVGGPTAPPAINYERLIQYNEAGEEIGLALGPSGTESSGIAIDESSGRIYSSNYAGPSAAANKVGAYGTGVLVNPPTATINPPSSVTYKFARLSGTVNSGGTEEYEATKYHFELCASHCDREIGYGEVLADGADHEVSTEFDHLEPETSYELTLVAANAYGRQRVEDVTSFETPPKPPAIPPAVTIDPVTAVTAESAHLSGAVDPMGSGEVQATTYWFEYTADGVEWHPLETQGPIEGTGPQAVSAELEGLAPNTGYSVRLQASNDGGETTSETPNPSFVTEAVDPLAEILPATGVLSTSVRLNGHIDPRGSLTRYYFQWGRGDCASSPCASIPLSEDGEAGSRDGFVSVHAELGGLSQATTYHYRLVAKNQAGEAISGGASFTTGAAPAPCADERAGFATQLPDCRAYEMVSPLQKSGGSVSSQTYRTRAAADGNAVTFVSQAAFAGTQGFPYSGAEYLSSRGPDGWSTHSVTPLKKSPAFPNAFSGSTYVGFLSPDLDHGVFRALAPNPDATPNTQGVDNLFLATGMRSGAPHFTLLSDSVKPLGEQDASSEPLVAFVDASSDFSRVAFEDAKNLTLGASGTGPKLYEWSDGEVRLAGFLPDSACGSPPCPAAESVGGAGAKGTALFGEGTNTQLAHAVSDDGSKVFFTAGKLKGAKGDVGFEGSLYVREDGARTTQIDESERSEPDPKGPGRSEFQWASPNGEEVLFFSKGELVNEDSDGEGLSLYRWRAGAPAGERLSLVPTPGTVPAHVIDASADGSFVDLLGIDLLGSPGRTIYVLHDGHLRKVVTLGASDPAVGELGIEQNFDQARITPDGRELLFHSRTNLTGYEPYNPSCSVLEHCSELYLYSYDADELVCVSCNPSGEAPSGEASIFTRPIAEAGASGNASQYLNTPISDNGRYVFFTSPDSLVPGDTNGRDDAYVYDTAKREARLLSSGQCNCDSIFMTASPSGRDAFFTTAQQLVRADTDNLADLYDARLGGGIAAQNALAPAECQGDACQPTPAPPSLLAPASSLFAGAGDLVQRRDCSLPARRLFRVAQAERHGAKQLRRLARRGARGPRARRLLRRSRRLTALSRKRARRARRLAGRAKRCRRANRRAGR